MDDFDKAIGRQLQKRGIAQVPGCQPEEKPWSRKLLDYLSGMKAFEAEHAARLEAQAAEAAKHQVPLTAQLRELIAGHPTNDKEVN